MPKPRVKRPTELIAEQWKLSKRGYYYRICKGTVCRITWRDHDCEDSWFLSFGMLEQDHTLQASIKLGWYNLTHCWIEAERHLISLGLVDAPQPITNRLARQD